MTINLGVARVRVELLDRGAKYNSTLRWRSTMGAICGVSVFTAPSPKDVPDTTRGLKVADSRRAAVYCLHESIDIQ